MSAATYVPAAGSLEARYVLVGEQPGRQEVLRREPFVGPSGRNLQDCLHAAGILWSECYRTNVIKDLDAPLEEYFTLTRGKVPHGTFTQKGEEYLEMLRVELCSTKAHIIIACGNVALWALCSRIGITHWRGSVLESTLLPGRKVLATLHPATWTADKLYSDPDAFLNKHIVIMDLIRAKQEGSFAGIRRKDRQLLTRPTYQQAMKFIDECHSHGMRGATIDYDIELQPKTQELSCIGLSHNSEAAMCIPFVDADGDYFSAPQELCIMQELDKLFSSRGIAKRGQNVIFDSHFLLRKYGIRTYNLEDTMVAQGIIAPEYRKSLEFITSVWTDIPYYKHDGKMWLTGVSDWEKGWQYNCYDVLSCAEAHPKQLKELESQGNLGTYWRQRRLIEPLTYMMEHGIRVNIVGMQQEHEECKQQVADLDAKINMLMDIGEDYINLDSPKQLADYFYVRKGVKPYLNPDTHKPTVDITALTRLANRGFVEASLILKLRQLKKRMATFLNIYKVDADGRIRCSYNPVGTKYGRISSSANIFGTGGNLQHVPHSVLSHFMADEGYVIYSLDMSQIENRIVAYVGNIVPMIQAFENGLDVHRLTAAMISTIMGTPRTYDTVTSQERQDLGKRPNHAFNYGYGYKSFSLRYEIPERDAKRIHTAYHAVYPGLSKSYWKFIEDELKASRSLTNLFGRRVQFFGQWSEKLLHEAYSCIPQSTCGDLVNDWGVNFIYYNTDPDFHEVELLTQIHDSIELQIPLRVSLAQHARILCKIRVSLEQRLQFGAHTFSIPVDLTVNNCLNKEKGIEIKAKNFSHEACDLEPMLESAIHKLGCAELDYLTH